MTAMREADDLASDFEEVMTFARRKTWDDINRVAPPKNGYQSWAAPFKHIADFSGAAPRPELEQLIRCAAAINAFGARLEP